MTGAEQVSQPWQNNIFCLLQRWCFCGSHRHEKNQLLATQPQHIRGLTCYLHKVPQPGRFPCSTQTHPSHLIHLSQCQPATAFTQHDNKTLIVAVFATCFKTRTDPVFLLIWLEIYCTGTKWNTDHLEKKTYIQRQSKIYYRIIYFMQDPKVHQPGLTRQN